MGKPYTEHLYCHLVWATWDRLPLITPVVEPRLHAAITSKCRNLKAVPIAINGTEDHVHLLVRLPRSLSVADLAKEVKGASSHLINHEIQPDEVFRWQGGYGAFTISADDVPKVKAYIRGQKRHHAQGTAEHELERTWDDEIPEEGFRQS